MFEGAALLGICDKIVPGLIIGALRFGHLPMILVPAGPMPSGLANKEKQRIRQLFAEGKVGRKELLESESASYHGAGTCTFYGTANSNQMMMDVMGLHMPGASFINPGTRLRQAVTRAAIHRLTEIGPNGNDYRPLGRCIDERAIVNAIVDCWPPAARPTTRSISRPWRGPPASSSIGRTLIASPASCR